MIIQEAKSALLALRNLIPVTMGWVPGHAGILLNECSDVLAKRGSQGITSNLPPPQPGERPTPPAPRQPFVPAPVRPDHDDLEKLDPTSRYSLRPRKRGITYKQRGSEKQDYSGIDFTMLEPTKKKRKHAQIPTTSAPPCLPALASPPPRRIGLARFGYISSKSSSSSSSAPHQKP